MKAILCLLMLNLYFVFFSVAQTLNWTFETGAEIYSSPVVAEESVYFGSGDGYVYAVHAESGEKRWQFETGGPVHSTPLVDEGVLYVVSKDGSLYALHASTGVKKWSYTTQGEKTYGPWDYYVSSPVSTDHLVLFGSGDGHVYALNKEDGDIVWTYSTGDIVHASPIVSDGIVYIGSFDGIFYALDASDGSLAWTFDTIGDTYFPKGEVQKAAIVQDGIVYFGSRDYNIYALDAKTGTGRWNMKERGSWVVATPLFHQDKIYFGTSDSHHFYSMDAQSGEVLWQLPLNMRVYGSAIVVDNVLYFGCFNGKLYAVNPDDGDVHWTYQTEESRLNYKMVYNEKDEFSDEFKSLAPDYEKMEATIMSLGSILSTPAVKDDTIFFGSSDGRLYAVQLD